MVNPMDFLKLKKMWEDFRDGHPRMMPFARAIAAGYIKEGTVFDLTVTDAAGNAVRGNFRLTEKDLELFRDLAEIAQGIR